MDVQKAHELARRVVDELAKVAVGQDEALEHMVVTLMAGGHALLEGVPGTGKTLMARCCRWSPERHFAASSSPPT